MVAMTATDAITSAKTIIIKIGSSLLVEESSSRVNADWIAGMARDIAMLRRDGKHVVVVQRRDCAWQPRAWH